MRYGPFLVTLDWVLWGILLVGGLLFAADKIVNGANSNASLPLVATIAGWRYFGAVILVLILMAAPLGLGLAFWSAKTGATIKVESTVPREYAVQTPNPNQPNVNVNAPNNSGVVIGNNQGQINIQTQRQPRLSLANWKTTKLADNTYQSQCTLNSDIPTTLPRVSFIAQSPTLISLKVSPSGGVGFGVIKGTVQGGQFMSFANVTPPYAITVITKEQEQINLQLSDWNPLDG